MGGARITITWVAIFSSAIVATVLLAHNHKNLNAFQRMLGLGWLTAKQATNAEKALLRAPLINGNKWLPKNVFNQPKDQQVAVFDPKLRYVPRDEEHQLPENLFTPWDAQRATVDQTLHFEMGRFCKLIANALPGTTPVWKQNPIFSSETECSADLPRNQQYDGNIHSSLFVQIRADEGHAVSMVRLKLVSVPDDGQSDYRQEFAAVVRSIFNEMQWQDLNDLLSKIDKLEPFAEQRFGLDIRLSKEYTAYDAYNFTIKAAPPKVEAKSQPFLRKASGKSWGPQ